MTDVTERPPLLTADEVARRLGVARWRAYELIRTGVLAAVHLGRTVRVDPLALEQFIASGGAANGRKDE